MTTINWPDLTAAYCEWLEGQRKLSPKTVASYREGLEQLQAVLTPSTADITNGDSPPAPDQISDTHIRLAVARLHARGASPATLALRLSAWRGFFRWCQRHVPLLLPNTIWSAPTNPAASVRAPKRGQRLPHALPIEQAVGLVTTASATASTEQQALSTRDAAVLELLYSSGLRLAEIVALDVSPSASSANSHGWIDLVAADVHVLGKGGKWRVVPMGQAAVTALQRWLTQRSTWAKEHENALFISVRGIRLTGRAIQLRLAQLGLRQQLPVRLHPHRLRHSFASHLLQSSGDLRAVQELLGHANIRTTQVYTRLDFGHLSRVYDSAHPRAHRKPS